MDGSTLSLFGQEFASASYPVKVQMIDAAIARVMVSQETETGSNRNQRAKLADLKELRAYYADLSYYSINPSQFNIGWFTRH